MSRLYYSFLYGFDIFKVRFENPEAFRSLLRNYSLLHALFSSLVIIGIDAVILLQDFGTTQVLAGTDYPFTIMDREPARRIDQLTLDDATRRLLRQDNALRWLGRDSA